MAKYLINYLDRKSKINKNIYGHFCEHLGRLVYDGIWVGPDSTIPNIGGVRKDVIEALRQIRVPIMRWPGGCYADTYHWKEAVGPQEKRIPVVNRTWGGSEDNSFGTNEFMNFCEEVGAGAYVTGNIGSGTIQEMVDWVAYIHDDAPTAMAQWRRENGREEPWQLAAFGIGNEVWGCGGQMRPEYYADLYRQAAHFVSGTIGGAIPGLTPEAKYEKTLMIASGPNDDDYEFTDKFMRILTEKSLAFDFGGYAADGLSLHYYSNPVAIGSPDPTVKLTTAADFDEWGWYNLLCNTARMEELITRHDAIMTHYDPKKKVGLMVDEWGAWYRAEPGTFPMHLFQQNTIRDAVLAAINLNIFNKHSDRVHMATIAQMVNVLQAVILTEGEKMLLTPTYHVFDMYKDHQEATLLGSFVENQKVGIDGRMVNKLFESCSVDADGNMLCTICNTSFDTGETIEATVYGVKIKEAIATVLTDEPHAMNTFDNPDRVATRDWNVELTGDGFKVELPAASVVSVKLMTV